MSKCTTGKKKIPEMRQEGRAGKRESEDHGARRRRRRWRRRRRRCREKWFVKDG